MEGVEELVVVVDGEVDGSGSSLDDRLKLVDHVDVRIGSQLEETSLVKLAKSYFQNRNKPTCKMCSRDFAILSSKGLFFILNYFNIGFFLYGRFS